MFYFKSKDGLVVTCSNAGYWDPYTNRHYGRKLHLEPFFHVENKGQLFIILGKIVTPEHWAKVLKTHYDWDVTPIKLIEVEWE